MKAFVLITVLFLSSCGPTLDDKYIQGYHEGLAAGTAACPVDEIEIEVEPSPSPSPSVSVSPSPSPSVSPSPSPSPECRIYIRHGKKILHCKKHKERD